MLKKEGIKQSMSGKGNCYENTVIEKFFGILKNEMFYCNNFETIEDFIFERVN